MNKHILWKDANFLYLLPAFWTLNHAGQLGFIIIKKRSVPEIDSWGTPHLITGQPDLLSLTANRRIWSHAKGRKIALWPTKCKPASIN